MPSQAKRAYFRSKKWLIASRKSRSPFASFTLSLGEKRYKSGTPEKWEN